MQSRHMLGNKQGLNSNSCRSGLIKTFLTIGFTIDLRGLHRIIYTTYIIPGSQAFMSHRMEFSCQSYDNRVE